MSVQPSRAKTIASRVFRFPLARIVTASSLVILPQLGIQALVRWLAAILPQLHSLLLNLFATAFSLVVGALAYHFYVRVVEQRSVVELSLAGAWREAGLGALIGIGLISATIAVLSVVGVYRAVAVHDAWSGIASSLTIALSFGFLEELVFRGIVFRITDEWLGTWVALVISSTLFGLLHALNPNASTQSTIAVALEAGLLLGAAFVVTRRLWLAVGIHVAWNFTQGGIFGVAVSGNQRNGLIQAQLIGPEWLSGGDFGVEASFVAVVVCLIGFALLLSLAWRQGNIRRPH